MNFAKNINLIEMKKEIEKMREAMYLCASKHNNDFQHPEVIRSSQRVDYALNAYDRLKLQK